MNTLLQQLTIGQPAWLWGLCLLPLLLVGPLLRPVGSRWGAVLSAGIRCLAMAALLVALSDPRLLRSQDKNVRPPVMVVVDRSSSIGGAAVGDRVVNQIKSLVPAGRDVEVSYFAAMPWRDGERPAGLEQTDIERALDSAGGVRGDVTGADVVLLTDGRSTRGDARAAAERLAARGARVHVLPTGASGATVDVAAVEPPIDARLAKPAAVRVTVRSNGPTPAVVSLTGPDGKVADSRAMTVDGDATVLLRYTPTASGPAQCVVGVDYGQPTPTTRPAVFDVEGPPRVLVVDAAPAEVGSFVQAIGGLKMPVDVVTPDRLPPDLTSYAAVVLSDLRGDEFSTRERLSLRQFVEDRGSGLVVLGGNNVQASAWRDNPLAELLPVRFTERPAKVKQKPPEVSICFVIDVSGSMQAPLPGSNSLSKLQLVKQSVLASIDALPPEARISVVTFSNSATLTIDAASVANKDLIAQIVENINVGGGTSVFTGADLGLQQLSQQPGDKFVVVLTDGQSEPPRGGRRWEELPAAAVNLGVQWTSIAVGPDADSTLLKALAGQAGGVFKQCVTSDDVPRVFIDQANRVRRTVEQKRSPFLPSAGPQVADLGPLAVSVFPQLTGMVPAEEKGGSRVQLVGDENKPLAASWQAGAGRVITFGGNVKADWAAAWPAWADYAKFWSERVGSVASAPPPLRATVSSRPIASGTRLTFSVTDEKGKPAEQLQGAAAVLDGPAAEVKWTQSRPGVYQADVLNDAVSTLRLSLSRPNGRGVSYLSTVAGKTSESAATGIDLPACQQIASAGNGLCAADASTIAQAFPVVARAVNVASATPLWPFLLVAGIIIWPVDVWTRKMLA